MKLICFLFLALSIQIQAIAQSEQLLKYEKSKTSKVKLGMSTQEIKIALGNPSDIQLGVPDFNYNIDFKLPSLNGQLLYTTWIYNFQDISIKFIDTTSYIYSINGILVTKDVFNSYKNDSFIFIEENRLILHHDIAKALPANPKISVEVIKNMSYTGQYGSNSIFSPVLFVTFEKGTQSVLKCNMYFLIKKL